MSITATALPYGMRNCVLQPYTDAAGTTLGSKRIKLPVIRTLSFSDTEEFSELRGEDRQVASHGNGSAVEWDLEAGGLNFESYQAMAGGTIVESGVAPAQKKVYSKRITDQRPWFLIEGQAISDSGGDLHTVLYMCKATGDLTGEFTDGEFYLTAASGIAIAVPNGTNVDKIYDFVQNETAVPISMT
jgi:hypothetical protein